MKTTPPKLIVGVGASAGGMDAFKRLLTAVSAGSGMAFLFVQYLDPMHELTQLLGPHTKMRVTQADQGVVLRADTVYIIRPDTFVDVRRGKIEIAEPNLGRGMRLPVDHLFRSLAREYGARAVGIVLSGPGSDGSDGLRQIKASGGLTIAQKPATSRQGEMAHNAIDTGAVDLVLDILEMPAALQRFADLPPQARIDPRADATRTRPSHLSEEDLRSFAAVLESELSFDLQVYKPSTVERRVLRRMGLSGFEDVAGYLEHLRREPAEQQALVRDLLIRVTDFFRDSEAFAALRELVVDPLVAEAKPGATLRAWVPGCATGEEAYSIAMEFLDSIDAQRKRASLQVFATDIDQDALALARRGVYGPSIAEHMSADRLQTYFTPLDGRGYQVSHPLRNVVSFAVHDVTKDPPFSRMQLVSCRNVLIYLAPQAQEHVLELLHFALEPEGFLFLSMSESPGPRKELFTAVSRNRRIYKKIGVSRPIEVAHWPNRSALERAVLWDRAAASAPPWRRHEGDLVRREVLAALVPPTIVVSGDGSILFSHGELGPYLRIPEGESPRLELRAVLRDELAPRVRAVLYKCRRRHQVTTALSSLDTIEDGRVRITATPALGLGPEAAIITFETVEDRTPAGAIEGTEHPARGTIVDQLESELQATREDLRTTFEELETTNEAVRSANEESTSMNEELQSANQELEATTEELRSLNEDLTNVNAQLREKIELLEQAHDDLNNFFSSTKIATIFLNESLRINRLTPAARELLSIDDADCGRYVGHIARELLQDDLEQEAKTVLEQLSVSSRELRTSDGRWVIRQVLPYRTESRRVEGVVVTFADITALKTTADRLAARERQQSAIARIGLHALREPELDSFMDRAARDVQQTLQTDFCKILELQPGGERLLLRAGVGWKPGLVGSAHVDAGLDSQAGYTLESDGPVIVDELSKERRFSGPSLLLDHEVVSGLSCTIGDHASPYGVISVHTKTHRRFSAEDANFLQAVAAIVASAVSRHQTRVRLALERGVARVLADATDPDELMPRLLERVANDFEGSVAESWCPTHDGRLLERRLLHVAPPMDPRRVETHLDRTTYESGEGAVGRVFAHKRAVWCTDLGDNQLFVRRDSAKAIGLVSAIGFPVCAGNRILGVVTVLSSKRLFADESFLRSLESLGRSIGDTIERSQYEQRVRKLAAITESSHDAILTYDYDGTVTEWLPGSERLFGYTAAEMVGSSIERIVPEHLRESLWSANDRIRRGEVVEPFETVRLRKDGTSIDVSIRSSPVKGGDGKVVGISSTDRDITRQKETERKLVEADRQKDEFLAMLGHELRNPLAAIRTAAELMKLHVEGQSPLGRTQAVLERQTSHMAKLLDGLLDVSRIIRGKIELELEPVDFAELCRDVVLDVMERLEGRSLDLRSDIPPRPICVDGDKVRLAQIIDNLLSNALKFTPDGGSITVGLNRDDGFAALSVRDTGIGIEHDLLPHIFEVFRQSKQSLDRAHGGLGIGLALVKSLAELHGGTVAARSEGKGRGAEFVIRLPISPEATPDKTRPPPSRDASLRVLLIEDNEDVAQMLADALRASGYEVAWAHRGQEGIEMAKLQRPDVVLCDLGLPDGISGFDVASALRADPITHDIRLVALSGYGRPEDRARGKEAGFDTHLTKPVDMKTLQQAFTDIGAAPPPPNNLGR